MVSSLSLVVPLIPDLVERLHSLKELHERAAQFAGSVAYIADSQEQISKQTNELQSLLSQVSLQECGIISTMLLLWVRQWKFRIGIRSTVSCSAVEPLNKNWDQVYCPL